MLGFAPISSAPLSQVSAQLEFPIPVGSLIASGNSVSEAFFYAIGLGSLVLTGQAPGAGFGFATTPGSITLSGLSETVGFGYTAATGTLTLTGQSPIVAAGYSIATGSLVLTGQNPSEAYVYSISAGSAILTGGGVFFGIFAPNKGSATLTTLGVTVGIGIPVGNASCIITGQVLSQPQSFAIPLGSLTLTGQSPLAVTGLLRPVLAGSEAYTGYVPLPRVDMGAGSMLLATKIPTLNIGISVGVKQLALSGKSVTLSKVIPVAVGAGASFSSDVIMLRYVYSLGVGSIALTGQTPALLTGQAIGVPTGSMSLTGKSTNSSRGFVFSPDVRNKFITTLQPFKYVDAPRAIPAGSLTLTGRTASEVFVDAAGAPAALAFGGYEPKLARGIQIAAGSISFTTTINKLNFTSFPATYAGSLSGKSVAKDCGMATKLGSLTITTRLPFAGTFVPATAPLALGGQSVVIGRVFATTTGSFALSGKSLAFGLSIIPSTKALSLTGVAPNQAKTIPVGLGSLVLTGQSVSTGRVFNIGKGSLTLTSFLPAMVKDIPKATITIATYPPGAQDSSKNVKISVGVG